MFRSLRERVVSDGGTFADKVDRAAESALLKLAARCAMVITLPLIGFVGAGIYNKLDKTADSTARLEEKVTALLERQIPEMKASFDSRFNAQADRITTHDRRIDRLEEWRNTRGQP
jgi:hypothetical protein